MKKLFMLVVVLLWFVTFASADRLDDAISWMYDNGLTIHAGQMTYKADRWLRRDEAAKFFVQFSKLLWKETYVKTAAQCTFSDINQSRSDLKDIVVESCRLWLFQWSQGKFTPQNNLTNAQAITVLVRLMAGMQSEVWLTHRADNYYAKANELGVLDNVDMNNKNSIATRGNVGIIIYDGNTIYFDCITEWEISNSSLSPQYYKPCCSWLEWFEHRPNMDGAWAICVDPDKWTPLCQQIWTSNEWWYYPDGTFLRKDNACSQYTSISTARNRYNSSVWFSMMMPGRCYDYTTQWWFENVVNHWIENLNYRTNNQTDIHCFIPDENATQEILDVVLHSYACDSEASQSWQQVIIWSHTFTMYTGYSPPELWGVGNTKCYKTTINNQLIRFDFMRWYDDFILPILSSIDAMI